MSQEVHAIGKQILSIRKKRDKLDEEEEALWKRFFQICDDLVGSEVNYKQILPDIGYTIAREMHESAPRLNVEAFRAMLTDEEWKAISTQTRVFDESKLEIQINKGTIETDLVNQYTETKSPVPHKKFRISTKSELKEAE